MKNIRIFLSEKFQFLVVKFSIYLNRRVFVMNSQFLIYMAFAIPRDIQTYVPYFRQCESSFFMGVSRRPYRFDNINCGKQERKSCNSCLQHTVLVSYTNV